MAARSLDTRRQAIAEVYLQMSSIQAKKKRKKGKLLRREIREVPNHRTLRRKAQVLPRKKQAPRGGERGGVTRPLVA